MIKPGVATGDQVQEIFKLAKSKKFALPAVNVIGSSSINGVLEISKELNSPVIIQFSNGGAIFNAGKGMDNSKKVLQRLFEMASKRIEQIESGEKPALAPDYNAKYFAEFEVDLGLSC